VPVSYSLDSGQTWTASSAIPPGAYVGSDRAAAGRFYACSNGQFYVSTNQGLSFVPTGAAVLPTSGVRFKAVAGRAGDIWLSAGTGGLWHSRDGGQTFMKLANVQAADNIGFGKARDRNGYPALYSSATIGAVHGIFRSDDQGRHWTRVNDDRHQYAVTNAAITGDPRVYGRVYVSTNGRGVIYGEPADIRGHESGDHNARD
jgi:xyloglucan-specific exo-beta-1,4-glucanase